MLFFAAEGNLRKIPWSDRFFFYFFFIECSFLFFLPLVLLLLFFLVLFLITIFPSSLVQFRALSGRIKEICCFLLWNFFEF